MMGAGEQGKEGEGREKEEGQPKGLHLNGQKGKEE